MGKVRRMVRSTSGIVEMEKEPVESISKMRKV